MKYRITLDKPAGDVQTIDCIAWHRYDGCVGYWLGEAISSFQDGSAAWRAPDGMVPLHNIRCIKPIESND